jgi:type I restriction enzyme, S subunit
MKKGWQVKKLGEVCEVKSGKSNTQDAAEDGEYIFFDRSKKIKRSNRYLFDCEALIIPGEGTEFIPRHFNGKFDLHQRAYAIFGISEDIDVRYLLHYLYSKRDYFPKVAVGATVKSLRLRHFLNFDLRYPAKKEQERIVELLDAAFAKIDRIKANAEHNRANARALFENYLNGVFTNKGDDWTEKKLGEVCEVKLGGTPDTNREPLEPSRPRQRRRAEPSPSHPLSGGSQHLG